MSAGPRLVHLTTTDMSLALLLGPQLSAFAAAGYEVIGASAPGPYVAGLEAQGIRHLPLRHATRAMAPHRDLAALAELRSAFRRLRPDIVHTHNPKPGVYGRLAARAAGVPAIVNTVHGLYALPESSWSKRTLVYSLERAAARCSHAELVQNLEDLAVLEGVGVPPAKLRLLGNGVDLVRFDPGRLVAARVADLRREMGAGPDDIVCTLVGRLVADKGYPEMFEAATALAGRVPGLKIVVVGPLEPDKHDAIGAADVERARLAGVRFLGFRADIEDVYGASDLYVLASRREGFPRSAMEAAAMGVPTVATDIRGCRQVVEHGRTGLLVRPRHPRALADAIAWLAAEPAERARLGQAARQKALRDFDQRQVIDITLETYERVLRRHPSASGAPG